MTVIYLVNEILYVAKTSFKEFHSKSGKWFHSHVMICFLLIVMDDLRLVAWLLQTVEYFNLISYI